MSLNSDLASIYRDATNNGRVRGWSQSDSRIKETGKPAKTYYPKAVRQAFVRCPGCGGLVVMPCVLCGSLA